MQQPGPMFPVMPTFPHTNITTDQIQKYLDENKQLILAILDNQNLGKLAECARYQVQLQKNLMYLAAIADAQPQTPTIPTQLTPRPVTQQGGFYIQHPQAAAMAQQQPHILSPGAPFTNPRPLQAPPMHLGLLQMPLRSSHNDRSLGGNNSIPTPNSGPTDKPDGVENANSDGRRNSSIGHGGGDGVEERPKE